MNLLIKGGRVIDPQDGIDRVMDVLVEDDRIARVEAEIDGIDPSRVEILDASGKIVAPGFIDLHVHTGEPGREDREDVGTTIDAAVAGGYTAVVVMPDTDPCLDSGNAITGFQSLVRGYRGFPLLMAGAVTKGLEGAVLAEMADLVAGGAVGFATGEEGAEDPLVFRRALEYSRLFHRPVMSFAQDHRLVDDGMMNEGVTALRLGLRGITSTAEEVRVARDLALAERTGGRIHVQQVSTARSVDVIRAAKARGVAVTAEVSPLNLFLTEEDMVGYPRGRKVMPPFRTRHDVESLRRAAAEGIIDAVAGNHRALTEEELDRPWSDMPFGSVALETTVGLCLTLVDQGVLTLARVVELLAGAPARILGLERNLHPGCLANLTLLDVERPWTVESTRLRSPGSNNALEGVTLTGAPWASVIDGQLQILDAR